MPTLWTTTLWNRSGTIERHGADDIKSDGAKAFFYIGGTLDPMTVYENAGQGVAHTHPVLADANGRWPDVFVPYIISYDVYVTNKYNQELSYTQQIPNPNPVEVSTTITTDQTVQTGAIHAEFTDAPKAGYVRLNGGTIGKTGSTATEYGNDFALPLYTLLWNNLSNVLAPVTGGRVGHTAATGFAAGKLLTLPDCRGRVLIGDDDHGTTSIAAFGSLVFTAGSPDETGSTIGVNSQVLTEAQLPPHFHRAGRGVPTLGPPDLDGFANDINVIIDTTTARTEITGSGDIINNIPRAMLVCWYIKL